MMRSDLEWHACRPFGHILSDGGLHSDNSDALRHLWLTRIQRTGPDISTLPALFNHGMAAYWDLVDSYCPGAGSGQRLKALQRDATSEFQRGFAQAAKVKALAVYPSKSRQLLSAGFKHLLVIMP